MAVTFGWFEGAHGTVILRTPALAIGTEKHPITVAAEPVFVSREANNPVPDGDRIVGPADC